MRAWFSGLFFGLLLGINGYKLIQYEKENGKIYSKEYVRYHEVLACSKGVVETVQFMIKDRKEPADCNFESKELK